jgi:hypothetical protein
MTIERNIDTLFLEELDIIAAEKNYLLEAERRLQSEFISSPPAKGHRIRNIAIAASAAAAVLIGFVVYSLITPFGLTATVVETEEPVTTGSWISATEDTGTVLAFSDGSEIVMEQNTEMRVHSLKSQGAHLLLERGNIDVSVAHKPITDWRFDAGPFHVHVTGTRFSVNWVPENQIFLLDVIEGTVTINGPMLEEGKALARGNRIEVSLLDQVVQISKQDTVDRIVSQNSPPELIDVDQALTPDSSLAPEESVPEVGTTVRARRRTPSRHHRIRHPSWRDLARKGAYSEAVEVVEELGFAKVVANQSSQDMMLLGDAARLSHNINMASKVYKLVRKRFPRSSEAQRAAFILGRMQLEQRGNPKRAARWFDACYRDNSHGTMAREAAGRLIESLESAGELEKAKQAATTYLNRYPRGPHTKLAQKVLSISVD